MRSAALPLVVTLGFLAGAHATPQPAKDDVTARVILGAPVIRAPLGSCAVPEIAALIGRLTTTPTGVEMLPGPCTPSAAESEATQHLRLEAMTVADALNTLVKLDPRYYWTESDGVIVVRPLAAWTDRKHFLHGTVDVLKLEKANIAEALNAVMAPLRPGIRDTDVMRGIGEISLDIGPLSIVEALDAIVRAHGQARWAVSYCRPEPVLLYATVRIYTFDFKDQHGIGVGAPRPLGRDGKNYDPCKVPG